MTSNEEHWQRLIDLSRDEGPLSQAKSKASLKIGQWYSRGRPHEAREVVRRQIAAIVNTTGDAPEASPTAILMAGPPGAGKTGALREALKIAGHSGPIRRIDADHIKDEFIVASLRDGTFHSLLVPPEIKELAEAGDIFHPRELATLVHSESAFFAERLADRAVHDRQSFILDATMQNQDRAVERVTTLKEAGYQVSIVEVMCSRDQALQRTYDRWLAGRELAQRAASDPAAGWNDALGGRFTPPDFVKGLFTGPDADSSGPHAAARRAMAEAGADRLIRYRVDPGRAAPVLDAVFTRRKDGTITRLSGVQAVISSGSRELAPGAARGSGRPNPLNGSKRPSGHTWTPSKPKGFER